MNIQEVITDLAPYPDRTVTLPVNIRAGALCRRQVRTWLQGLRLAGDVRVDWHEEPGRIDSLFAISMRGLGRDVSAALRSWPLAD
jgi:hypothetical protein